MDEQQASGSNGPEQVTWRYFLTDGTPGRIMLVDSAVEFVSGRVAAIGLMSPPPMPKYEPASAAVTAKETRPVYFEESGGFVETSIYDRDGLGPGNELEGPAIIEQMDTTVVVHPGQTVRVDAFRNLLISIGGADHAH